MSSDEDTRNIEVKAQILTRAEYEQKLEIAAKLTKSEGEVIYQRDVFFHAPNGMLKIRYIEVRLKGKYHKKSTQTLIFIHKILI